jgi:hypothetical protein
VSAYPYFCSIRYFLNFDKINTFNFNSNTDLDPVSRNGWDSGVKPIVLELTLCKPYKPRQSLPLAPKSLMFQFLPLPPRFLGTTPSGSLSPSLFWFALFLAIATTEKAAAAPNNGNSSGLTARQSGLRH